MKRFITTLLFAATTCVAALGQATKPSVMVFPSDNYCIKNGYCKTVMKEGSPCQIPDYERVFKEDDNMRTAIRAIGNFMSENSFPLEDGESAFNSRNDTDMILNAAQGQNGGAVADETELEMLLRSVKPDILLTVDMKCVRKGPQYYVDFALDAFDSATNKRIDGLQNEEGSHSSNVTALIKEGVLSAKDAFLGSLMSHFEDMRANGREISIVIKRMDSWNDNFNTEYEYNDEDYELSDLIRTWMNKNCEGKRFKLKTKTANLLEFSETRIKLYGTDADGEPIAQDAEMFGKKLGKYIQKVTKLPKGSVGVVPQGVGKVYLFVGEKVQ